MHARNTFPKRERFQYGYQFRRVYERGRKTVGRYAAVYVLEETANAAATASSGGRVVGIVAGRKLGNAVQRNRAKRLLREAYRLNKGKLKSNIQLVMIARSAINARQFQEVEAELLTLLKAAGAMLEP